MKSGVSEPSISTMILFVCGNSDFFSNTTARICACPALANAGRLLTDVLFSPALAICIW